eukprot:scaffold485501_cov45-Prasinocladus_malaysianus.AAC.1
MDDVAMESLGFTATPVEDEQMSPYGHSKLAKQASFGQPPLSPTMSLDSTNSANSDSDCFNGPSRTVSMSSVMSSFSIKGIVKGVDTTTDEFR